MRGVEVAQLHGPGQHFLAEDMARSPQQLKPLEQAFAERIEALVGHLPVDPYEELGDEALI